MKTKDIITIAVSSIVIIGAVFYVLGMGKTSKPVVEEESQAETIRSEYTGDFDKYKETIDKVTEYNDYGSPSLENIGRENPFAPID